MVLSFAAAKTVCHDELVEYFRRLQQKFENSGGIPVVGFDGIDKDSVEAARSLWNNSRVIRMKVMTTRFDDETATCQLVIFELSSSIHSRVLQSIGNSVQQYLTGVGCYDSLIKPIGDARFDRLDCQGEIEPDESYVRLISSQGDRNHTLVVEVGWY